MKNRMCKRALSDGVSGLEKQRFSDGKIVKTKSLISLPGL